MFGVQIYGAVVLVERTNNADGGFVLTELDGAGRSWEYGPDFRLLLPAAQQNALADYQAAWVELEEALAGYARVRPWWDVGSISADPVVVAAAGRVNAAADGSVMAFEALRRSGFEGGGVLAPAEVGAGGAAGAGGQGLRIGLDEGRLGDWWGRLNNPAAVTAVWRRFVVARLVADASAFIPDPGDGTAGLRRREAVAGMVVGAELGLAGLGVPADIQGELRAATVWQVFEGGRLVGGPRPGAGVVTDPGEGGDGPGDEAAAGTAAAGAAVAAASAEAAQERRDASPRSLNRFGFDEEAVVAYRDGDHGGPDRMGANAGAEAAPIGGRGGDGAGIGGDRAARDVWTRYQAARVELDQALFAYKRVRPWEAVGSEPTEPTEPTVAAAAGRVTAAGGGLLAVLGELRELGVNRGAVLASVGMGDGSAVDADGRAMRIGLDESRLGPWWRELNNPARVEAAWRRFVLALRVADAMAFAPEARADDGGRREAAEAAEAAEQAADAAAAIGDAQDGLEQLGVTPAQQAELEAATVWDLIPDGGRLLGGADRSGSSGAEVPAVPEPPSAGSWRDIRLDLDIPEGTRTFGRRDLSADHRERVNQFADQVAQEAARREREGLPPLVMHIEGGGSGRAIGIGRAARSGRFRAESASRVLAPVLAERLAGIGLPDNAVRREVHTRGAGPSAAPRRGRAAGDRPAAGDQERRRVTVWLAEAAPARRSTVRPAAI
ncbi:MAG: hypothetical protein ACQSGP_15470, partial [Frankia sp.]